MNNDLLDDLNIVSTQKTPRWTKIALGVGIFFVGITTIIMNMIDASEFRENYGNPDIVVGVCAFGGFLIVVAIIAFIFYRLQNKKKHE